MRDYEHGRFCYKAIGKALTEIHEKGFSDPSIDNRRVKKWRAGWSIH